MMKVIYEDILLSNFIMQPNAPLIRTDNATVFYYD